MLGLPVPEMDTAEIRLLRAISELSARLFRCEPGQRDALRETIQVLKRQLLKLIDELPVPSDLDIQRAQAEQYAITPIRGMQ